MSSNSHIAHNTAVLYVRMLVVLVVSLYVSRLVLNALGVDDFGIFNVVAGFVALFSFLESTLSSSVQRYYNYEGTQKGDNGYNHVFTASIVIAILASVCIVLLLETVGLWYINCVMVIPVERIKAANIVFQFSVLSFIIMLFQMPYNGLVMAKERMTFFSAISIVEVLLKLLVAFALVYSDKDKLVLYSALMMLISLITTLMFVIYSHVSFSFLKFSKQTDKRIFKSLSVFSGWNFVGTFAFMTKGQGVNMVLNYFFGPVINASRAVAYQIYGAISGFSSNISIAFRPQIVNSYAERDIKRAQSLAFLESRICFALLSILVLPVSIEIEFILHLWLGETVPEHTASFVVLVLLDALVCSLNTPVTQLIFATGRIKKYQLANTIVNLILIPLCCIFLAMGFPSETVFVLTIVLSIINHIVCVQFAGKECEFSWRAYCKQVIFPCSIFISFLIPLPLYIHSNLEYSFLRLLFVTLSILCVAFPLSFYIILTPVDRNAFVCKIKEYLNG